MGVVGVYGKAERERATLIHACEQAISCSQVAATSHTPSSGVIVKLKLSRSAGSGKCVFIVEGRSSSVKSAVDMSDNMHRVP